MNRLLLALTFILSSTAHGEDFAESKSIVDSISSYGDSNDLANGIPFEDFFVAIGAQKAEKGSRPDWQDVSTVSLLPVEIERGINKLILFKVVEFRDGKSRKVFVVADYIAGVKVVRQLVVKGYPVSSSTLSIRFNRD